MWWPRARPGAGLSWLHLRPDLVFTDLRGNMARRVDVAEDGAVSAVVVAVAAMERLGWADRLSDVLDPVDVLPQSGQGAIAVQCRADDAATRRLLAAIDHEPTHRAVRAERAVLAALGGSCTVPSPPSPRRSRMAPGGRCRVPGPTGQRGRAHRDPADPAWRRPRALGAAVARALLEGGGAAIEGFGGLLDGAP